MLRGAIRLGERRGGRDLHGEHRRVREAAGGRVVWRPVEREALEIVLEAAQVERVD